MKEELIGNNGAGIPAWVFSEPNFAGYIQGGSGTTFFCHIDPENISISDVPDWKHFFYSAVARNGILELAAYTRATVNGKMVRHPDLFAGKIITRTISYFEQNGSLIHTIRSRWRRPCATDPLSDNFAIFVANAGNLAHPNKAQLEAAVRMTPSYRIFAANQFTEIGNIEVSWEDAQPKKITVDFTLE